MEIDRLETVGRMKGHGNGVNERWHRTMPAGAGQSTRTPKLSLLQSTLQATQTAAIDANYLRSNFSLTLVTNSSKVSTISMPYRSHTISTFPFR